MGNLSSCFLDVREKSLCLEEKSNICFCSLHEFLYESQFISGNLCFSFLPGFGE
jgi:hypothetical protein